MGQDAERFPISDWLHAPTHYRPVTLQHDPRYPRLSSIWIGGILTMFAWAVGSLSLVEGPDRRIWILCRRVSATTVRDLARRHHAADVAPPDRCHARFAVDEGVAALLALDLLVADQFRRPSMPGLAIDLGDHERPRRRDVEREQQSIGSPPARFSAGRA